jgi:geranylgeranyl pyrophosphate synthase
MAILAGDAMMTLAFELIAADAEPALVPALVRELASGSGPAGMIGGQALDMAAENASLSFDQLASLHRMKTGALITCACRTGAIAASADDSRLDALTRFGSHLGLAFQIADDLLDVTATAEQLGKHTRKDRDRGKNTYPALLGLQGARDEAKRQIGRALGAIEPLGAPGETLRQLARYAVDRDH